MEHSSELKAYWRNQSKLYYHANKDKILEKKRIASYNKQVTKELKQKSLIERIND